MQQRDVHFSVLNLITLIISDIFSFAISISYRCIYVRPDLFVPSALQMRT